MSVLEYNQQIYVQEDGWWTIKGCYEAALKDKECVMWSTKDSELILPLLIVSLYSAVRDDLYTSSPG
jgi:hypothetical protein